jgi:selenocysteine lyase/cysteine desulfurase
VYDVCFTANASSAIHLVAESFRFTPDAPLVLAADNHNSVNGIREYARRAGTPIQYLPLSADLRLAEPEAHLRKLSDRHAGGGLFAYPAQSNFSGVRHPLSLVRSARAMGFQVLLDAAAYVPTNTLSLQHVPADFVAVSMYKMFGYPTGIGALIARRESLQRLNRPWFAGGTVEFVSVQGETHLMRKDAEGFEDGTADFLGLSAVTAGFEFLETIGMDRVGEHVASLTGLLIDELRELRHRSSMPMIRLYGPTDHRARGGTVAFNVVDMQGRAVPFALVEARARAALVSLRGGCFCNPGASETAFGFPAARAARCLQRAVTDRFSIPRFTECMDGHAVGAVRASLGISSNENDVRRLVNVLAAMGC